MTTTAPHRDRGFTLIELMIVVAIIGLLAAVASSAYIKYVQQTKSSEASLNLKSIGDSSSQYFQSEQLDANGSPLPLKQFPTRSGQASDSSEAAAPAEVPRGSRANVNPADWETPVWKALKFIPVKPHYYQYRYSADNRAGGDVVFTARAIGDLDGDGIESDYRIYGISNPTGATAIQITPVIIDPINPLE